MKKILSLVLLLTICSTALFAQNYQTVFTQKDDMFHTWLKSHALIDCADGSHIFYSNATLYAKQRNFESDGIYIIDEQNEKATCASIERDEDFFFLNAIENGEDIVALYRYYNKKAKKFGLYLNTVSKNATQGRWDPEEIISIETEKSEARYVKTAVSPDGSKMAIFVAGVEKKGGFEGAKIMVYDNQGHLVWDNNAPINLANSVFGIPAMIMNNKGEVFCTIYSYEKVSNTAHKNHQLHILAVSDDNATMADEAVDFGEISNAQMLLTKNGQLAVAGYYCPSLKDREYGTYAMVYDVDNNNIVSLKNKEFPANYKEGAAMLKAYANYVANQNCNVVTRGLFEFADGSLGLVGEQHGIIERVQPNGMVSYVLQAKNIMYNHIVDGEVQELDMYKKNQIAGGAPRMQFEYQYISVFPFLKNNTLYLLYNDNVANFSGKQDVPYNHTLNSKKGVVVMRTISSTGSSDVKVISNAGTTGRMMVYPLYVAEDGFVVTDRAKKDNGISKIRVDF